MSKRYKLKRRQHYYFRPGKCWHKGCKNEGVECRLPDNETGIADEYFCGEHAFDHGYCRCCGEFWAGITAFDFSRSGLCPHCQDQVDADFDEPGVEEEDYPYPI